MSGPRRKAHSAGQVRPDAGSRPRTNQRGRTDTSALKEQVGDQWPELLEDLAPQLGPAIARSGRHGECPVHGGTDGFRLFDDFAETGGGICNTCGAFADGLALLQWANGWTFPETVAAIREWLGIDNQPARRFEPRQKPPRRLLGPADTEPNDEMATGPETDGDRTPDPQAVATIERIIDAAEPDHDRLAMYFRHRGLSTLPPDTVAYVAGERYYSDDGTHVTLPAMVAGVQAPDGTPVAIFRTFLSLDDDGKAEVENPKKLTKAIYPGATNGAAIRLRDPDDGLIGIAEGIETAEAIHQGACMPCWAAVSAGGIERFVPPEGVTHVVIWADNDISGRGQAAANALANRLYRQGMPVSVVVPPDAGTDWLDVLCTEGDDALYRATYASPLLDPNAPGALPADEAFPLPEKPAKPAKRGKRRSDGRPSQTEPDQSTIAEVVAKLNEKNFVTPVGGKVHIATEERDPLTGYIDLRLGDVPGFKLLHMPWRVPVGDDKEMAAADIWLRSRDRREYKGLVFAPGKVVPDHYNLWQGFPIEPRKGNCSLFWQLTYSVICNGNMAHYRYTRGWLAHMMQFPAELPGVAIVVLGKQGIGKGSFSEIIGALTGAHYMVLTSTDQLVGRFGGHLMNKVFVVANEAVWLGNKAAEGTLKAMITDPMVCIEQKFKEPLNLANCKRLLFTSNKSHVVPMEADDRRFLVMQASDTHKEDIPYFSALRDQMYNRGGLQALMYDLLHEDLSGFDVRTKPVSPFAFDIKLRSAEPIVRWWYERLHDGVLRIDLGDFVENAEWNQTPVRRMLHADFMAFCRDHGARTFDEPTFGKELRKMLPGLTVGETRPRTETDGGVVRPHRYVLPTLEACRQAFEGYMGASTEIWD